MILVDGADPRLKPLAAGSSSRNWRRRPAHPGPFSANQPGTGEAGYPAQIEARADGSTAFSCCATGPPLSGKAALPVRDSGEAVPVRKLCKRLAQGRRTFSPTWPCGRSRADTFSPSPTSPAGELAYFAQLKALYEAFRVPMRFIVPRASFTLQDRG